jgi:hypothetical protein
MPESQFDWTKLLQLVLFSSCEGVAFKKKKKKWWTSSIPSTDYLSRVLTPLRIRWIIPLKGLSHQFESG